MKGSELIPNLPHSLFWDVDPMQLDAERDAVFIIARVMDRGTRPDVDLLWSYYGDARIRSALLHAPHLERRTRTYFSRRFDLPLSAFRSFSQSVRRHTWTS